MASNQNQLPGAQTKSNKRLNETNATMGKPRMNKQIKNLQESRDNAQHLMTANMNNYNISPFGYGHPQMFGSFLMYPVGGISGHAQVSNDHKRQCKM